MLLPLCILFWLFTDPEPLPLERFWGSYVKSFAGDDPSPNTQRQVHALLWPLCSPASHQGLRILMLIYYRVKVTSTLGLRKQKGPAIKPCVSIVWIHPIQFEIRDISAGICLIDYIRGLSQCMHHLQHHFFPQWHIPQLSFPPFPEWR